MTRYKVKSLSCRTLVGLVLGCLLAGLAGLTGQLPLRVRILRWEDEIRETRLLVRHAPQDSAVHACMSHYVLAELAVKLKFVGLQAQNMLPQS